MAKSNEPDVKSFNIITEGTTITGDINSSEDIKIDGVLKGNLYVKGKLVLTSMGSILGEINASNADISGSIEGKIIVNDLLSLKSSANVISDIVTNKLAVEPGAIFTGTCTMGGGNISNGEAKQ